MKDASLAWLLASATAAIARPCCSRAAAIRTLQIDDFALRVGQLRLWHDILGGQRREPVHIVLRKRKAASQRADRRRGFRRFAPTLFRR